MPRGALLSERRQAMDVFGAALGMGGMARPAPTTVGAGRFSGGASDPWRPRIVASTTRSGDDGEVVRVLGAEPAVGEHAVEASGAHAGVAEGRATAPDTAVRLRMVCEELAPLEGLNFQQLAVNALVSFFPQMRFSMVDPAIQQFVAAVRDAVAWQNGQRRALVGFLRVVLQATMRVEIDLGEGGLTNPTLSQYLLWQLLPTAAERIEFGQSPLVQLLREVLGESREAALAHLDGVQPWLVRRDADGGTLDDRSRLPALDYLRRELLLSRSAAEVRAQGEIQHWLTQARAGEHRRALEILSNPETKNRAARKRLQAAIDYVARFGIIEAVPALTTLWRRSDLARRQRAQVAQALMTIAGRHRELAAVALQPLLESTGTFAPIYLERRLQRKISAQAEAMLAGVVGGSYGHTAAPTRDVPAPIVVSAAAQSGAGWLTQVEPNARNSSREAWLLWLQQQASQAFPGAQIKVVRTASGYVRTGHTLRLTVPGEMTALPRDAIRELLTTALRDLHQHVTAGECYLFDALELVLDGDPAAAAQLAVELGPLFQGSMIPHGLILQREPLQIMAGVKNQERPQLRLQPTRDLPRLRLPGPEYYIASPLDWWVETMMREVGTLYSEGPALTIDLDVFGAAQSDFHKLRKNSQRSQWRTATARALLVGGFGLLIGGPAVALPLLSWIGVGMAGTIPVIASMVTGGILFSTAITKKDVLSGIAAPGTIIFQHEGQPLVTITRRHEGGGRYVSTAVIHQSHPQAAALAKQWRGPVKARLE